MSWVGKHVVCVDAANGAALLPGGLFRLELYKAYLVDHDAGTNEVGLNVTPGFTFFRSRFHLPEYKVGDEVVAVTQMPPPGIAGMEMAPVGETLRVDGLLLTHSGAHLLTASRASDGKVFNSQYDWRFLPAALYDRLQPAVGPPAPAVPIPCPDCNGTGVYVGLIVTEACRLCGGSKTV